MLGGSAELPYRGNNFATRQNVIVVSFNYRLGPLGFLALPEMGSTQAMGLADQRLALSWLHSNIAAFNGDPKKVTLVGQSAGASSIAYMIFFFPETWPMFHRAILQSGAPAAEQRSSEKAFSLGLAFQTKVNCSTLDCLKDLPFEALVEAFGQPAFGQTVLLDESLLGHIASKNLSDIPIIFGNAENELFFPVYAAFPDVVSPEQYAAKFNQWLKEYGFEIDFVHVFPCHSADCRPLMGQILSDAFFVCQTEISGSQNVNQSFGYRFDHRPSWIPASLPLAAGVPHGSSITFLFDNVECCGYNGTANEIRLASRMSSFVGAFVRQETLHAWLNYNGNDHTRLLFNTAGNQSNYTTNWQTNICKTINQLTLTM